MINTVFEGKKFVLLSTILLSVLSMFLVGSCVATVDVKPAVPSFTLKEIAQPYDVPPSTTTIVDGYTGEETTINYPGYTVENKTIYIVIKNQPFTPYKNDKGETMNLYYEYCYRGHYSDDVWIFPYPQYYGQSDFEYTMIPFKGVPSSGQVDVRVRALIGTLTQRNPFPGFESGDGTYYRFEGVEGDFGVITVSSDVVLESTSWPSSSAPTSSENSDSSASDNFNPPVSPQQPSWATYLLTVIATVCIITVSIAIVMYHNKRHQHKRKTKHHSNNHSNSQFIEVYQVKCYG